MAQPRMMSCSQTFPVPVAQAFDEVLPMPLEELFDRRFGPIPPVRAVDGQDGVWASAGQTRVVHLAGGGSMHEQLTVVDRPEKFGYELSSVTGPLGFLVSRIEGTWTFEPAGTGVRITWSWITHPTSAATAWLMPAFAKLWRGYAQQSLKHLEELLLPT